MAIGSGSAFALGETGATIKDVTPTIIIGLGGTGKEILSRIRRFFFERYKIKGFPIIRYLWIDTDPGFQVVRQQGADDFINKQIQFQNEELIAATIPQAEFLAYFNRSHANRHIFEWMSPKLQEYQTKGVVGGAYQIRPLGKLAFYHQYHTIKERITRFADEIRAYNLPDQMLRDYEIRVSTTNINVHIVCSLAGGTGSGMLIDTGFLVNNILRHYNPVIAGFLMLPPVFGQEGQEGMDVCYANAYATLRELNHYFRHKPLRNLDGGAEAGAEAKRYNDYCPNWDGNSKDQAVAGPPLHSCYLFSNTNIAKLTVTPPQKHELFNMVAERIFLDFEKTPFSETMRSILANTAQMTNTDYDHLIPDPNDKDDHGSPLVLYREFYPCSYSSFGVSKIYINRDRLQHAAAYYLAMKIINSWIRKHNVPGTLGDVVGKLMMEIEITGTNIDTEISKGDEGLNRIQDAVTAEISAQRAAFLNSVQAPDIDFASALVQVHGAISAKFAKPMENPDTWGDHVKAIEMGNLQRFLEARAKELRSYYVNWIDDPFTGFDLAETYLKSFVRKFREWSREFGEAANIAEDTKRQAIENFNFWLLRIQEIQEAWRNNIFVFRNATLRTLLKKAFDHMELALSSEAQYHVYKNCEAACDKLIGIIGEAVDETDIEGKTVTRRTGLLQEGWQLYDALEMTHNRIKEKWESFQSVPAEYRNVPLAAAFDYQREIIDVPRGTKSEIDYLKRLSDLFLNGAEIKRVFYVQRYLKDLSGLEELLLGFSIKKVGDVGKSLSALSAFFDRVPDRNHRGINIGQVMQMCEAWLAQSANPILLGKKQIRFTTRRTWGIDPADSAPRRELLDLVKGLSGQGVGYEAKENYPDSIVFYSEVSGIPLFYVEGLERWQKIYETDIRKKIWERHNELHIENMIDLIPPSQDDVEKLIVASEVFLLGVICKIILPASDTGSFYYMHENLGVSRRVPLGPRSVAIQTLKAREEDRNRLMGRIQMQIERADNTDLLRMMAVLAYYNAHIYPLEHVTVGQEMEERRSPEYTCLERRRKQLLTILETRQTPKDYIDRNIRAYLTMIKEITDDVPGTELKALRAFGPTDAADSTGTNMP